MHGTSRAAAAEGLQALNAALTPRASAANVADDLFAILSTLDANASLRRALVDSSREGADRQALAERLFAGHVGKGAAGIVATLSAQRWSQDRDLTDTLESLAVQATLAGAERAGHADAVEDELFRFERIVAGNNELRDTLAVRNTDVAGKADLVTRLLQGKAAPETVRLAVQSVRHPRGRRIDQILRSYLHAAAARRNELTAVVTTAVPLTEQQEARLRTALENHYGKAVTVQPVIDPDVIGGIHVRLGDEVIDGTILHRLDDARRHLSGGH
ncbi:MAG: F0F1 ATP synthase subunit delta [Nostocoides sp.]